MYRFKIGLLVMFVIGLSMVMVGCRQNSTEEINVITGYQEENSVEADKIDDNNSGVKESVTLNKIMIRATLNSESEPVYLSEEDSLVVNDILEKGVWNNESVAECINNCFISINGYQLYYHSECGTFNDNVNGRNLVLDNETRLIINNIFEKYVNLDVIETPM